MKDYVKNKESPYLKYWDINNLYGLAMLQKLLLNKCVWVEDTQFNKDFIKIYDEQSYEGYFLETDIQYLEKLHEIFNDLPFLPERMKLEMVKKLVANLHDKTEYVIHIRNLKQALNHGLILKKIHRVIKFIQKAWLKPHIKLS